MIPATVYLLCALTSVACSVALIRAYLRTPVKLLFWCALCFVGLAVNNVLLFVDLAIVPQVDLRMWRAVIGLMGVCALLYGLLSDAQWR